jgi:hypothetical protein
MYRTVNRESKAAGMVLRLLAVAQNVKRVKLQVV